MDFNVHFPNLDEIKLHIQKHKMEYAIGTTAVVASGVTFLVTRQLGVRTISVAPVFNNTVTPVFNNIVNNGGHMRKIIRCVETGELWLSVTETAASQGKNIALMSQHLNHPDVVPTINGLHFVIEALAAA